MQEPLWQRYYCAQRRTKYGPTDSDQGMSTTRGRHRVQPLRPGCCLYSACSSNCPSKAMRKEIYPPLLPRIFPVLELRHDTRVKHLCLNHYQPLKHTRYSTIRNDEEMLTLGFTRFWATLWSLARWFGRYVFLSVQHTLACSFQFSLS